MSQAHAHEAHTELALSRSYRVGGVRRYGAFAAVSLVADDLAARCSPGRFVMVAVPGEGALLRRPLSLYSVVGGNVGLLIEARGAGSARLAAVEVGDTLAVAGPLGTGFSVAGVRDALLVGGGIGCAPLQYLADDLRQAGARVAAALGFRDHRQARLAGAFEIADVSVASEDGSIGRAGTVVDLLSAVEVGPQTELFVCGPLPMIAAVQAWAADRGLRGQASLEAHMACGNGSCHGCVVDTAQGLLRVCSEGPVFALDEVTVP